MATILCMNNGKVNIMEHHIDYFLTIKHQMEDCDTTVLHYKNLHAECVQSVYDCLIDILSDKLDNTIVKNKNIPSLLVTADFLMCQPVFKFMIDILRGVIKNAKDTDELRIAFDEDNEWVPDEYARLQKEHSWCQKINHCKSKFL